MSALPKAVQRQIAEANKIADQLVKAKKEGQQPPPPDPNAPPPAAAAPPAQQPAAAAPPVVVTPAGAPPPDESYERKYKVLQGKYNAEIPRLTEALRAANELNRTLQGQLTTLQGMISTLNLRGVSAPVNPPGGAPAPAQKLVNDDEIKQFGPDLYDFITRVAKQNAPAAAAQVPSTVTAQLQQVTQQVQRLDKKVELSDQQKFEAYLDQHAPGWVEQNNDENFIAWLTETDPYSGVTRQDLLDQAATRFDGPRVVALFKGFQNENAVVTPPQTPAPGAPPAAQQPAAPATPQLEKLVAPGLPKAGPAGAPNEAQKRIYTRAEIEDFNRRRMAYVTKGRKVPDALVQEEKDILRAANEGRVSG